MYIFDIKQMASTDTTNGPLLEDFIGFLNESWTAYHATAEARRRLLEAGFAELDESQPIHEVKVRGSLRYLLLST